MVKAAARILIALCLVALVMAALQLAGASRECEESETTCRECCSDAWASVIKFKKGVSCWCSTRRGVVIGV